MKKYRACFLSIIILYCYIGLPIYSQNKDTLCIHGDFVCTIGKYLVYYTQTIEFSNQKRKYAKGTKVIDVSANDLAKITIPLPPIEEQERIAGILDKFDTLVNSISEGLPREIELRRKQYEYYREKLLSFPTE